MTQMNDLALVDEIDGDPSSFSVFVVRFPMAAVKHGASERGMQQLVFFGFSGLTWISSSANLAVVLSIRNVSLTEGDSL